MPNLSYTNLTSSFGGNNFLVFKTRTSQKFNRRLESIIFTLLNESPALFNTMEDHIARLFPMSHRTLESNRSPVKNFTSRSDFNLLTLNFLEFQNLKKLISNCFCIFLREFSSQYSGRKPNLITSWVNIVKDFDGKFPPHKHHSDPLNVTGIYFVSGDYFKGTGGTRFWIHHENKCTIKSVAPVSSGTLIFFQGTFAHAAPAYQSDVARICIPFDIRSERSENGQSQYCLLDAENP